MSGHGSGMQELTPELLLRAYAVGIFPMAESRDDPGVFWVDPQVRGIMPLDDFHIPRRLKKTVRSGGFEVRKEAWIGGMDTVPIRDEGGFMGGVQKHLPCAHDVIGNRIVAASRRGHDGQPIKLNLNAAT